MFSVVIGLLMHLIFLKEERAKAAQVQDVYLGDDEKGDRPLWHVAVDHEYDDGPPMRLKSALIRFELPKPIAPEQEAKLRAAAGMCPVHTALRTDIPVTMEFTVRQP